MVILNAASMAITISTVSSESAPRSLINRSVALIDSGDDHHGPEGNHRVIAGDRPVGFNIDHDPAHGFFGLLRFSTDTNRWTNLTVQPLTGKRREAGFSGQISGRWISSPAMKSIFVLTGAGISAESGIQTFRGMNGLWEGHRLEDVASPGGFQRDPSMVYRFYNMRRPKIREAVPSAAHFALARLERDFPGTVTLVTQNIDDLHERAGSRQVIHMHGEAMKARCLICQAVSPCETALDETNRCPACARRSSWTANKPSSARPT
jgi:hypothetical protein